MTTTVLLPSDNVKDDHQPSGFAVELLLDTYAAVYPYDDDVETAQASLNDFFPKQSGL